MTEISQTGNVTEINKYTSLSKGPVRNQVRRWGPYKGPVRQQVRRWGLYKSVQYSVDLTHVSPNIILYQQMESAQGSNLC